MLCDALRRRLLVLLSLAALAGCGSDKNPAAPVGVVEPSASKRRLEYPAVGLSLELPGNVRARPAPPPGVLRAFFDQGVLSIFAYRRREPLPRGRETLEKALERLERAARERGERYIVRDSRTTEVAGAPAVELLGDQTISRARLRTRSLHVYEGSAEYVVELLVPVERFGRLDRALFPGIRSSLELTGEVRPLKARGG